MSKFTRAEALAILDLAETVACEGIICGLADDDGVSRDAILDEIRRLYPEDAKSAPYTYNELYGSTSRGHRK